MGMQTGRRSADKRRMASQPRALRHLESCGRCAAEQVQPITWEGLPGSLWLMSLRCPNCGWNTEGVYGRAEVSRYEQIMECGRDELIAEIERVRELAIREEIDRFARALERGDILPFDF
jgi:hypothetical protein